MTRLLDQYHFESHDGLTRLMLAPAFAEGLQGDFLSIELPCPGENVMTREGFGQITTSVCTYDLRAAFAFRVLRVNERVRAHPELIRLSPTGEGWLLEVEGLDQHAIA